MKKTILIAAIAIATTLGSQAFAQNTSSAQTPKQEQCQKDGCGGCDRQGGKKGGKKGDKMRGDKGRKGDRKGPGKGFADITEMKDLNLTQQQITAIEELNKQQAEADKAARESAKAQKSETDRQKHEGREKRQQEYLAKLKTILTPDQYVKMLENKVAGKRGSRDMAANKPGVKAERGNSASSSK